MEGYLISWIIFDLWIVYLFLYATTHSVSFLSSNKVGVVTFLILFLLIVFGEFSGDYQGYAEILDKFSESDEVASNFEPFFIWLTKATNYEITLFRSVIGLVTIVAVYYSFKLYKELNIPSILLFTLIPFYLLSNVIRQGMAISICLLGLFLFFNNKKKLLSLLLIIASLFLHKSIILVIPTFFFLLIPFTKKNIILLLILLFPLIYLENRILVYITDTLLGNGSLMTYMTITSSEIATIFVKIMDFVFIAIILTFAYLSLKRIYKFNKTNKSKSLLLLTRLLFGSCYMYVVYCGLDLGTNVVANRFAPFMYIPLVIVMMKAFGIGILKKQKITSLLIIYFIFINLQIYRWFLVFF